MVTNHFIIGIGNRISVERYRSRGYNSRMEVRTMSPNAIDLDPVSEIGKLHNDLTFVQ